MNTLKTAVVPSSDEQNITAQEVTDIKTDLALENVDNTSDQDKPISTAQQNALDDKVDKEAGKGLSDENYTLAEKQKLANQSGTNTGDQDISGIGVNASDITDLQNNKVDKEAGKGLSDENYTLAEKQKLAQQSGVNTGDQDISGISTNANAINDIEQEQITQNDAISLNTAKRSYPLLDEQKLATIEPNATENQTDAFLLNRVNHTGTQSSETITHEATEGNVSGTATLDPTTPLKYWNLTGNFQLTGVTAIPLNENKVVTRVITTGTGVETLTIPAGWNVYGNFDPTKRNLVTILVGNVASAVEVDVIFNQPN